jgi:hypothetical protein
LIDEFRKHPEFIKAMREIRRQHRPIPKLYHPKNAIASDEWKYESGVIAGFDKLYILLTGETNE